MNQWESKSITSYEPFKPVENFEGNFTFTKKLLCFYLSILICNLDSSKKCISLFFLHSYILKVPFDHEESSGIVYLWIGSKADVEDIKLAEEIANEMFNNVSSYKNNSKELNCDIIIFPLSLNGNRISFNCEDLSTRLKFKFFHISVTFTF